MTKYVKLDDVLDYINASGLEAADSGNEEAEDRIAGIKLGIESMDTVELADAEALPSNIVSG